MNKRLLVLLTGISLILGACSLTPEYIRPEAPVPTEWPQGPAYNSTQVQSKGVSVTELSRERFFPDQQLQDIITMALTNNRDLRLAALNVERTRAMYGIQRAELFPAVAVSGTGGKQRLSSDLISPGDPRTVEQYNLNLGIASWEIDFFGRIRSLSEQALDEYLATEQAQRSAQISLVSEVAKVFLILAKDRENLSLAQSTLESQQNDYNLIKHRYDVGVATELDLQRAKTRVDAARRDIASFIQQVAQDTNSLNLLAGSSVPESLLPADLSSITPPEEISAGLSSEVMLSRPDIIAAEYRLKGGYALIGAARASFFPRISLTTSLGTASDELSGLFSSGTSVWNFAPQIVMPIFDARVWAALRVSEADQKILLTRYEQTIQTAFKEVADGLAVQGSIDRQLEAQQSLVNAVAETYRLANKRYNQGIDDYLGVLDAQRSLYTQQRVLIVLNLTKFVNRVNLYAVLGGGGDIGDGSERTME
jgi:outer membrane protein, multidrug efflux system